MIEDTVAEKLAAAEPTPPVTQPETMDTHGLDAMLAQRLEKLRVERTLAPNSAVRAVLDGRMEAIVLHRNLVTALFALGDAIARLEKRIP